MATIGTILIQAANQAGNLSGGGEPSMPGMGSGSDAAADKRTQDAMRKELTTQTEQGKNAPKFWTSAFKKMGIQMGLSGILKQSQIFTSTIGSIFQIFGAFVDVILAPFVPIMIPAMRWLARQLPTVAKGAQWVADKLYKGVSAVWNFLSNGKIWSNIGNFFKDMAQEVWDLFSPAINTIKDFFSPITDWIGDITSGIWKGIKGWYDETLAGKRVAMGEGKLLGKIGFTFPGGGGGVSSQGDDYMTDPKKDPKPKPLDPNTYLDPFMSTVSGEGSLGDAAITGGLVLGGGSLIHKATKPWKLGESRFAKNRAAASLADELDILGGKGRGASGIHTTDDIQKALKAGNVKLSRGGLLGKIDEFNFNPTKLGGPLTSGLHAVTKPLDMITNLGINVAKKAVTSPAKLLMNQLGGVDDASQAAANFKPPKPVGSMASAYYGDDFTATQRAPRVGGYMDDLTGGGPKPSALSNAVAKFQKWVTKTGGSLKNAAGKGAAAFSNVYDEGLSLADDVVKIAGKTPGMGFVGQVVSVGFKRVIPGLAGAYMVGETIQDVWKIVKSDAPWLGDWKSLDAYKAEAMGAIFGGKTSLLGGLTSTAGWVQKKMGFGDSISDWQKGIQENQKEKGVLSSGKLMDAIIRGTTGIGGAALSTFFPGLGTLAGTALYEGGRYATTGLNIPGIEGTVGGNVERYGEATDFSDTIMKAIESGWSKGVNSLGVR